jgi:uncharacterized membrane protein
MAKFDAWKPGDFGDRFSLQSLTPKEPLALRQALILAGIFWAITLTFALHRYFTFYASYDQGIFNQVFWNNLHGNFFQSSLSSVLSGAVVHDNQVPTVFYHRLGQHFTPTLLLWLPIYALFPSAATLVVLQVSLITAGGLVFYVLARQRVNSAIALLLLAGYYGSNAVIGPTFSNFHDLCQIPLFVFTLLLALEKRWWRLFWLMAVLTLLVRQDTGVILFGIGVYLVLSRRYPKVGIAVCMLSFAYIVMLTNLVMPLFSADISQRFMIERFGHFAEGNEASTLEILWGIISQPGRLLAHLFSNLEDKVLYLLVQSLPLALIPLRSATAWAIAGFPLLQLLLQQGDTPLSIHIRYAITLVPGLFYGATLWWAIHADRFKLRSRRFWIGCLILSVLIAILYNPHRVFYFLLPDSYRPWVHVSLSRQWQHSGHVRSLSQQIPPTASVSATTYLVPHVSGRREVLRMPFLQVRNDQNQVVEVECILADLWQLQHYQVAFLLEREHLRQILPLLDRLMSQNQYGIQALEDGVVLLQKGAASKPELLEPWNALRLELQNSQRKAS